MFECPALKVDLLLSYRHQLIPDDDLGPLYDLLIDQPQEIRRAIGELVYDHLIAQKFNSSPSGLTGFPFISAKFWALWFFFSDNLVHSYHILFSGHDDSSSEIHIFRMLQILREFSTDPILSVYVIDDVWEYMKAMKVGLREIPTLLHIHYAVVYLVCHCCTFIVSSSWCCFSCRTGSVSSLCFWIRILGLGLLLTKTQQTWSDFCLRQSERLSERR